LKTKIGNLKIFFIPYQARTYIKKSVYHFVDFRIKRAGSSNYGGRVFFARRQIAARKKSEYGPARCHSFDKLGATSEASTVVCHSEAQPKNLGAQTLRSFASLRMTKGSGEWMTQSRGVTIEYGRAKNGI
jgi:hypothetical protein